MKANKLNLISERHEDVSSRINDQYEKFTQGNEFDAEILQDKLAESIGQIHDSIAENQD